MIIQLIDVLQVATVRSNNTVKILQGYVLGVLILVIHVYLHNIAQYVHQTQR